jgi:hypothetical protein
LIFDVLLSYCFVLQFVSSAQFSEGEDDVLQHKLLAQMAASTTSASMGGITTGRGGRKRSILAINDPQLPSYDLSQSAPALTAVRVFKFSALLFFSLR